jgi:hypothetical protein
MSASRELKVVLSFFLVAAAAFIWIDTANPYPLAVATVTAAEEEPPDTVAEEEPAEPEPAPAREVRIVTLPFFVTEEPVFEEVEVGEEEVEEEELPRGARATINPFAPIVPPAPEPVAPVPGQQVPGVIEVPIRPPEEVEPPLPPAAPAPAAVAPAPPSNRLPRALPSGTLPASPSVLREQRNGLGGEEAVAVAPSPDLAARLALRRPEEPQQVAAPAEAPREEPARTVLEPPLLGRPLTAAEGPEEAPLTTLGGYLRANEVSFSGAVLGPVSVGLFRTSNGTAVVPLGQTLPGSDIVLTELSGQHAELTLADSADSKVTLEINGRR